MPQGIIIKGIGGFYYVKTDCRTVECRARGKFRNERITPLVGDIVDITETANSCAIDSIHQRRTELIRPSIANVDQAVIVFAAAKPYPNIELLERILALVQHNNLDVIICVSKTDLADKAETEELFSPYTAAGYSVVYTSTVTGYGIDRLKESLKNRISVFAGPSGVGKSTLLNMLDPSFRLKTGEVSEKIERGRHTTRHVELLELESGGYVADTPGFSSLDIDFIETDEVERLFPEFRQYAHLCRFSQCRHISEPGCAIKKAVENSLINAKRYNSYVRLYNEINKLGRKYK